MLNPCLTKVKDRSPGRDFVYFLAVFTIRIIIGYRNVFEFVWIENKKCAFEKIIRRNKWVKAIRGPKKGKFRRAATAIAAGPKRPNPPYQKRKQHKKTQLNKKPPL
jgi:hypothetical protein